MTILDFLRNNPGKHTATAIAKATGMDPYFVRSALAEYAENYQIIGHEQHGKIVYEYREPKT